MSALRAMVLEGSAEVPGSSPDPSASARKARRARPRDIKNSKASRLGRQVYTMGAHCVRDEENLVYKQLEKQAAELDVSTRSVVRGWDELVEISYACRPDIRIPGTRAVVYHLHPDGKPCNLPQAPPIRRGRRPGVSEANRRRWQERRERKEAVSIDKLSVDTSQPQLTKKSSSIDKRVIAYKEDSPKDSPKESAAKPRLSLVRPQRTSSSAAFAEFYAEYITATEKPVGDRDRRKAERVWKRMPLEKQLRARSFIPKLIDGRPPRFHQYPQNYLADEPWERTSVQIEQRERPGLRAGEIE